MKKSEIKLIIKEEIKNIIEDDNSKEKTITLFWITGKSEIIKGNSLMDAFRKAGYRPQSIHGLSFYGEGDLRKDYIFDKKFNGWKKIK